MPEGHSVHRITRQFERNFVGHVVRASSPQGRFARRRGRDRRATHDRCPRRGQADVPRIRGRRVAAGAPRHVRRVGLRGRHPDRCDDRVGERPHGADEPEGHVPRVRTPTPWCSTARARTPSPRSAPPPHAVAHVGVREGGQRRSTTFPPEPIGQVRVRLLTDTIVADLRGPTACEVLDRPRSRPSSASSVPTRCSTGARGRGAVHAGDPQEAHRHRAAAHGPGRRRRHRQRLPRRAAVQGPSEPPHPGQAGARRRTCATSGATGRSCSPSASRPAR